MLCLRAEVLDDDHQSCTSRDDDGFSLPINFGSSIHRYLRKAGAGSAKASRQWTWSTAFSSADGSPTSDFEDTKPQGRRCKEEKGGKINFQRYQLEQDVKELQKKLQEEIDLHLALVSAVEHSAPALSSSSGQLPEEAQELLEGIAILEINVSKLEKELTALECQLSQERNERRLAEYRLRHLPTSTSSLLNYPPACLTEPIMRSCDANNMEEEMDGAPLPIDTAEHPKKDYFEENLWHHPNNLSEEMILCMRDIFLILAVSSKFSSFEGIASSSSPQGHFSFSSLASSADSPATTSLLRSPMVDSEHGTEALSQDGFFDPYTVPGKVDWRTIIGPYNMAVEVSWLSVGKKELDYTAGAFKRFRLLVEQLARVNPSCMSCNAKLAFWINLYNALIMHAYLAYGVPKSDIKLLSLMQKVAYTVGGHSFSAADIEYSILKMKPPVHSPQLALALAVHKFKVSGQKKYSIEHPEPLLAFALSCGMYSSPAVRIFRPGNVNELLMKSMKDYVRASVGIGEGGKLLVPKLLHSFAKGNVEDSLLPEWICQFLSSEQVSMVKDCSSNNKWRLLGPRSFTILPFDSRFRYLFLLDNSKLR